MRRTEVDQSFGHLSLADSSFMSCLCQISWAYDRRYTQGAGEPDMAGIALSKIQKSFGPVDVLKGIDLKIADGEFLTMVGPSGCGKSTLLRIIAGLEAQSGGDVAIAGRVVNGVRPSERNLAMVFQSYALYPHLTVRENIETPLRLRDLSGLERLPVLGQLVPGRAEKAKRLRAQACEAAKTLKIDRLMDRKPGQLSGGQRQRVALGRAMVRKPAAFLMDEPLSNLDAALRVHMRTELAELRRAVNATFVYVTHDQAEALTMSDRVAVMMEGRILQLGSPDEIYRNPQDRRVAEFIGSPKINILDATVDGDGRVVARGLPLRRRLAERGRSIFVGVRPEHLDVLTNGKVDTEAWPFTLTHKENLGADYFLHGHLYDGGYRIVARADPVLVSGLSIGSSLALKPRRGAVIAFASDHRRLPFLES